MKIRGYDITEKRVAAVCAVVLLVVSLLAVVKQTNAAADTLTLCKTVIRMQRLFVALSASMAAQD